MRNCRKYQNKLNKYTIIKCKIIEKRSAPSRRRINIKKIIGICIGIIGFFCTLYFFWYNNQPCISIDFVHDVFFDDSYRATFDLTNENKYMIAGIEIKGEIRDIEPYNKETIKVLGKCFAPDYIVQIKGRQKSSIMFFLENPAPPIALDKIEHVMVEINISYIPKPFYYFKKENQSFTFTSSKYNEKMYWTTY